MYRAGIQVHMSMHTSVCANKKSVRDIRFLWGFLSKKVRVTDMGCKGAATLQRSGTALDFLAMHVRAYLHTSSQCTQVHIGVGQTLCHVCTAGWLVTWLVSRMWARSGNDGVTGLFFFNERLWRVS